MSQKSVKHKAAWRVRTRKWAVELLGGHCTRCDTTEDLDFDHIIPGSREFPISQGIADCYSRQRLAIELEKCQLLCRHCHQIKSKECGEIGGGHNRIDDHGTEAYHDRTGCRCQLCIDAKWKARIRRGERKSESQNIYGGRGRYGTITEHGGGTRGVKGCKCALCRAVRSESVQRYRSQA